MRRSVDRLTSDRLAGLGRAGARALALAALAGAPAGAGDGDRPELAAPSEMTIISKPATRATSPAPSTARPPAAAPRSRAMLALPGLTTPTARPSPPVESPGTGPGPAAGELTLDAPLEMRPLPDAPPAPPASNGSRSSLPLILESSPMDELPPPGGATSRSIPSSKKPTTPTQPAQAPARRPRLFGFLGGGPSAPKPSPPGRAVVGAIPDPLKEDPSSESALKRRIERQARDVAGNRARSVEVKLDGKDAVVQVTGVKFYQKRALRKQIEGIPALSGLRSTIEIGD